MSDKERKKLFERTLKVNTPTSNTSSNNFSTTSTTSSAPSKGSRIKANPEEVEIESTDINKQENFGFRLSEQNKKHLQKVLISEARIYNLFAPSIEFRFLDLNKKGYYNFDNNCIYINENEGVFNDFYDSVETVIHEMRHYYQFDVMLNLSKHPEAPYSIKKHILSAYALYNSDKKQFQKYWNNGLEIDARAFASARVEDYQDVDFDSLAYLPLKRYSGNQILRMPNHADCQGNLPPLTVSAQFKETSVEYANNPEGKENEMGGRDTTDISEEAQRKALLFYAEIIQYIQQETENTVKNMCERVRINPYLQTQNAANVFVQYYNRDLPDGIKKVIEIWKAGDGSIASFVRNAGGGEEAVSKAQRLEDGILGDVTSNFKNIDELNLDVSGMKTNVEAIKESADIVCSSVKRMDTYEQDIRSKINSLIEDNTIYESIGIVVDNTFAYISAALSGTVSSLQDLSEEYSNAVKRNLQIAGSGRGGTKAPSDIASVMKKRRRNLE